MVNDPDPGNSPEVEPDLLAEFDDLLEAELETDAGFDLLRKAYLKAILLTFDADPEMAELVADSMLAVKEEWQQLPTDASLREGRQNRMFDELLEQLRAVAPSAENPGVVANSLITAVSASAGDQIFDTLPLSMESLGGPELRERYQATLQELMENDLG